MITIKRKTTALGLLLAILPYQSFEHSVSYAYDMMDDIDILKLS